MNILIILNYLVEAFFIFMILPLFIFSYEADDDENSMVFLLGFLYEKHSVNEYLKDL